MESFLKVLSPYNLRKYPGRGTSSVLPTFPDPVSPFGDPVSTSGDPVSPSVDGSGKEYTPKRQCHSSGTTVEISKNFLKKLGPTADRLNISNNKLTNW